MSIEKKVSDLIQSLIRHWACWDEYETYYLTKLAPKLIINPEHGDETEKLILSELRPLLNDDEWRDLPQMIAEMRSGILRKIESELLRLEEIERVKQEAKRIATQKKERHAAMLYELRRRFNSDFISATAYFHESCADILTEQEFEAEKFSFVKSWLKVNGPKQLPDDEQIAAISSVHGHIQVVARAGSGKTTTLVSRVLFLLKHCRIAPAEIMILAFNRKAALEVRRRLLVLIDQNAEPEINRRIKDARQKQHLNWDEIEADAVDAIASQLKITLPHVMTFHALAYAIVHPEESLLYNGTEGESQGKSRAFQQVIDDHLREPAFREKIRELMLAHFREDWDRIVEGRHDQSKEEFLRFRRSLTRESLGGEYVKSYGEKIIADFLFEHDIAYKYEQNHWWSGINYRPDFTISTNGAKEEKKGVVIEYFGLTGDPDYDEMSKEKRKFWKDKSRWTLLEFTPKDIASEGAAAFIARLKTTLLAQGIQCARLSEDEIWNRIRNRAIDKFTKASVVFVGRCRKQSLSPIELRDKINSYSPLSPVERMFLNIVHSLYAAYLNRLPSTGEEDFDGLMQRAAQAVEDGITSFQRKSGGGDLASLRYICIDEFQDFSDLFYRLLVAIRKVAPRVELFCVGDDWQAINGFAGSDLRFFNQFEQYVGKSRRLYISTNYRSASSIVAVGNALMSGLGKPALASKKVAGKVWVADLKKFEPTGNERMNHSGDIITPAVLRIANRALASGINVVMLCRQNRLPRYLNFPDHFPGSGQDLERYLDLVRSRLPEDLRERITISTAHKYKGMEKPMVIVLDLVTRSYPLIHPDWMFSRILGDSPQKIMEEERRLLYVALTRAADTLVVFTEGRSKSPFLEELEHAIPLATVEWADYPPLRGLTTRLVVKVGNQDRRGGAPTFAIKDFLKDSGYQWQSTGWPGWAKSFPAEGFRTDILKSEVWSEPANGIDVRIFDETNTAVAHFLVDGGNWTCIMNKIENSSIDTK